MGVAAREWGEAHRVCLLRWTVFLDGKPLQDVLAEFQPDGGRGLPSVGYADADGGYELRFSRDRIGARGRPHGPHRSRLRSRLGRSASGLQDSR
jgi:hypothetical protein